MKDDKKLQAFRIGFCEKAAELGVKPSELLSFEKSALDKLKFIGMVKDNIAAAGLIAMTLGAAGGALTAWGVKQLRNTVDPSGDLLGREDDPVGDVKKINLIARYRNATDNTREIDEYEDKDPSSNVY
jgi:hypothetical protein